MNLTIAPLSATDLPRWNELARAYKAFYQTTLPDVEYDHAWQRLAGGGGVHALGARVDGELMGFVHYIFHRSIWTDRVCYLQDVFVDPPMRSHGIGRALVQAVASDATRQGATRCYWTTHAHNATARALYDRVAQQIGFIRYDLPLPGE